MKVIKKINNNVAVCLDKNKHELIAFGKGIGFKPVPYELEDLSVVTRTYYGIERKYLGLLNEIDESVFEVCAKIIDVARIRIRSELNPNLIFTLADHVNFAIERMRKGIVVTAPLYYDIEHLYTIEVVIGKYALKLIKNDLKVSLPENEALSIALHLINAAERYIDSGSSYNPDYLIDQITKIIEKSYDKKINQRSFNYSRFVTHLQYLLKRKESNKMISSGNKKIFEAITIEFAETYKCVLKIKEYLIETMDWNPGDEELLYLTLHINRLYEREDCYQ